MVKISMFAVTYYAAAVSTTVCATVVTVKTCQDIAMNRRLKLRTKKDRLISNQQTPQGIKVSQVLHGL